MAAAISPFFRDTSFDTFLFSKIGEERNGMLLSVVSALARLDLDPWREAASLSRLSASAATERLTSLLTSLPGAPLDIPAPAKILQLVKLLPGANPGQPRLRVPLLPAKANLSWPIAAVLALAVFVICVERFAPLSGPTGGASSSSADRSSTAKPHDD